MLIEQTETEHYYRHLEHNTVLQAKVKTIAEPLKCIGENMDPGRVNIFMEANRQSEKLHLRQVAEFCLYIGKTLPAENVVEVMFRSESN